MITESASDVFEGHGILEIAVLFCISLWSLQDSITTKWKLKWVNHFKETDCTRFMI